jgi:hypothetical protein
MKLIFSGSTRLVVLTEIRAYKIARLRLLRLLCRLLVLPLQAGYKHEIFRIRYGKFPACLWNYFVMGLTANRNEFEHWHRTRDGRVGEVLGRALGYLVIWQVRGQSVTTSEICKEGPFVSVIHDGWPDFFRNQPHQYARVGGRIVLIDFGEPSTRRLLQETTI